MASLNEIAYNILNNIRGGRSSHNDYYNLDQIKFNIKYYRSLFIRRDLQRKTRLEPFEQELKALTLTPVPSDIRRVGNNLALRTDEELPELLRTKHRQPLTYVGPINEQDTYEVIQYNEARYQSYNKFTSNKTRAFIDQGKLYLIGTVTNNIINSRFVDEINIQAKGIFEDPEKVIEFNTNDFYDHDQEFPSMPEDYIQRITQGLISGELNFMMQTQSDLKHNNRDN